MRHLSRLVFSFTSVFLVSSQGRPSPTKALFKDPYEFKMISSGDNRPAINVLQDSSYVVLTLLHHGRPLPAT